MTPEELFKSASDLDPWGGSVDKFDTDLMDKLRKGRVDGIADADAAEAISVLLHSDFMAYGTGGGERLTDPQARSALRALRAICARLGIGLQVPWQDFTSFRSYWVAKDGYGSWAARRRMVGEAFDPLSRQLDRLQDSVPVGTVVELALNALSDPAVIAEHLKRLVASVDTDPRLAVSVAKDLVESTAKLVLKERDVDYSATDKLPVLVSRAQAALRLDASGVTDITEEAKALKTILGSLSRLTQGVTELRNKVGVGHGRDSVPAWVRPRHARLAAGAATTWCNLMLETLGDPDAPWRD